ncbi:MAG TPA: ABC transporter ATP-binding protein [Brevefilum fermentans]|jgi:ABC-type multidrug transport system fused ATPase/permease subunit|uniref:Putative ABC transporter n=1 Tax=Candidatus Brevifilum fermentans TaxID=1986204 RepID=A0A1Y6K719_9CHLR|nr:ABC transporter ATP-binding protein [Brevefilum fermentans]MDI9566488.1 ABC transporter ATP-binding protein [Chloroflexota bacterium]OQB83703.1 MAG: putative multidrug export ATP-binding/permease protein [Chloroflexi bacterium ADurb.Bin120]SMX54678.1 putative ABC transporter [Brevefilum fermentans]HOM67735.1 ABC transporter ATP-binding protein [Brevefilum fermentans]HPX96241.1 ABC transporter ATP-binding protein [Brevefilum fermentans]
MKLLLRFSKKYFWALAITVLSMLTLVAAQLLIPWLIRTLIDLVTTESQLTQDTLSTVSRLALVALITFLARGLMQFTRSYMAHIAGWGVVSDARKFVYEHMQKLSLRFYEDKQTGQLMSRIINDTDLFERMISHAIPDVVVNVLTFLAITAVLTGINWKLTLYSMAPIPLVILALIGFSKVVRPAFRKRQHEVGELNAVLNDSISGVRDIKAFNRESEQLERVELGIERYRVSLLTALKLMAIFQPFIDFSTSIGQLVVIFFGGQMALQGSLSVADLVAFFLYLEMFYQPIRALGMSWEQVQEALAGFDRVQELLEESPDVKEPEHPKPFPKPMCGEISFEGVSFSYNDHEIVLNDINLNIPVSHVVALVGPTGVGKSTLVSLIPRFYDVKSGSIKVDGIDIREFNIDALRSNISIVLQDVFLFHGTVRENILFGNPKASDEEVIEAAKVANAYDFITVLPNGFDTVIGERGVKLSGGQRQRISIARAVLKNSPILILDEATSSVDTETELLIQQALERLMKGRTTIIIAHRLSTIRNADQIVVLSGDTIIEQGKHHELIEKGGLYQRLYTVQEHL